MGPRILFVGGTPRGFELIRFLAASSHTVVFAYILQEDDHEQRKVSPEIAAFCEEKGIPFQLGKKIPKSGAENVKALSPDIAFVCGWRTMIPAEVYRQIPGGMIGAHDSLLPKYRGSAPLNWAIINGEKRTGVTLFKIGDGPADSGDICGQKAVPIGDEDTAADVYPRVVDATIKLYAAFLEQLKKGAVRYTAQDEQAATTFPKRTPEDGRIDWTRPAREIYNLIRALVPPYPCAWAYVNGTKVRVAGARLVTTEAKTAASGTVLQIFADGGVDVACGAGAVRLKTVLNEQGEPVAAAERIASVAVKIQQLKRRCL